MSFYFFIPVPHRSSSSNNTHHHRLPIADAFGRLKEASVVRLLQSLVGLSDERGRPLDALLAAGDLLGQFPQPHGLARRDKRDTLMDEGAR